MKSPRPLSARPRTVRFAARRPRQGLSAVVPDLGLVLAYDVIGPFIQQALGLNSSFTALVTTPDFPRLHG